MVVILFSEKALKALLESFDFGAEILKSRVLGRPAVEPLNHSGWTIVIHLGGTLSTIDKDPSACNVSTETWSLARNWLAGRRQHPKLQMINPEVIAHQRMLLLPLLQHLQKLVNLIV